MVKWSKVEGLGQKGWFAASALMLALSMIVSTSNVLETFAAPLKAQVPEQIGFEGYLTDPNNATLPLDDGTYSIRFSVFNAATAGTELWAEVQPSVAITDGYFSTTLGSITSFTTTTIFDGDRWIAVRLTEETGERSPRTRVLATPFAFLAENVPWTGVDGIPAGFADGQDNDTQYSAGSGLTLSGTEFRVVTSTVQSRVTGTCAVGQYVRAIAADGTATCGTDANTTYTAGTGLNLSGGQFSIVPTTVQSRVTGTCGVGSSIRVINQDGSVICQADTVGVTSSGTITTGSLAGWASGTAIGSSGLTYSGSTLNAGGGLNIGTSSGANQGNISMSGYIQSSQAYGARVYMTTTVPVNPGGTVYPAFNGERYDPYGLHTPGDNAIMVNAYGMYLINCQAAFTAPTATTLKVRSLSLYVGGIEVGANNVLVDNQAVQLDAATIYPYLSGTLPVAVQCMAYQASTSVLNLYPAAQRSIEFSVVRLP